MVTSIILLNVKRNKVNEVAEQLADIAGISEVYSVTGNYDLVVIGSSMVDQGLIEMLLGNLAAKIINRIDLPVLVIGTRALA